MNRICLSLCKHGYSVTLVGRSRTASTALPARDFKQHRIRCFAESGKLFYLEYNIKLFFYLLFHRFDMICGIDLDTILPTFTVAKIRRVPFVYDAHEYFTEMEEVVTRPFIKKLWTAVETVVVPRVKYAYTISDSYAELFLRKYGTRFAVIRNATILRDALPADPKGEPYILYQGAVNVGRGLEELLEAMVDVPCKLYICGKGDIYDQLITQANKLGISDKIVFKGYVQPEELRHYTRNAIIGITFFSNKGLSNHYSLANRFSDYIHAGVPQIAMNYPEYVNFNRKFEIALLLNSLSVSDIRESLLQLMNDQALHKRLKDNCDAAKQAYNWQNEEKTLIAFYDDISSK